MTPDERFHGHVRYRQGQRQIPWSWQVFDRKKGRLVAWGEEFYWNLAMQECRKATMGARWWHWYQRKDAA